MKCLSFIISAALALPCPADISTGTGKRAVAPAEQQAAALPDLKAEKAALTEAIKLMTDETGAAAAEKQLAAQKAAAQDMATRYDATLQQADALGPQVEAQLQKEVSRAADMAEGKGLCTERDKKLHRLLRQRIPETGYDTSAAHDIGGKPAPQPKAARQAPPLRPLPAEL